MRIKATDGQPMKLAGAVSKCNHTGCQRKPREDMNVCQKCLDYSFEQCRAILRSPYIDMTKERIAKCIAVNLWRS